VEPQTERYLDLARLGKNDWWRYALGVLTIAFFWLVLGYLPLIYVSEERFADPLIAFVLVNFSIFMMLAGLAVATRWIHRRPLLTLITPAPRIAWTRIGRAAVVWTALSAILVVAEHFLYPGRYYLSFDGQRFLPFALVVLVLTPIQSATEELIFRGYFMQGLGLLTRKPLLIAVASSALIAVPHLMNPEVQQYGVLLMAANYFAIGMVLATIALRDGRLELAIGLHAVNNVLLALVANYEGSALPSQSVFTARELDPWYTLAAITVGGLAFHFWIFGSGGWAPSGKSSEPSHPPEPPVAR
jgi:membrane protease YdiL (CAAX protease family)